MTKLSQWTACWALLMAVTTGSAEETLSWADCVRLAAEKNPALAAAHKQVEAAEAGVGVARSALRPQLSVGASADRSGRDGTDSTSDTSYGTSVSVEQSLYSGGQKKASVHAALASLEGTAESGKSTGSQVTGSNKLLCQHAVVNSMS